MGMARLSLIFQLLVFTLTSVSNASANDCPCEQSTATLVACWQKADGDMFWDLVPRLYARALNDPNEFYRIMEGDTTAYRRFLGKIAVTVFTNKYDTAVTELDGEKSWDLAELRRLTPHIDSAYLPLHNQFIATVRAIEPTYQEVFFTLSNYRMADLLRQWQLRNGVPVEKIAPELLSFAVDDPNVFFEFMWTDTANFTQWLDGLPDNVFTVHTVDDQQRLAGLLDSTIARLEKSAEEAHWPTMQRRLIEKLKTIEVRLEKSDDK
jgi:hypothetical protein